MQRRELMSTLVAAGAGGVLSTRSMATALSSRSAASITKAADTHFIQAHDGTRLYWTQWGAGRPILFLNSAGMPTQMWDYQMAAFADQGHRCT
jgi:hypothetical protein